MVIRVGDNTPEDYNVWLYPGINKGVGILRTVLEEIESELEIDEETDKVSSDRNKVVFVIHGRNERRKDALFDWLRCLHLRPLEWEQAVALTGSASPSTFSVVQAGLEAAQAVIALFTDDEEVTLRPELRNSVREGEPRYQARANVIFEAGMASAAGGEKRTIFLEWGDLGRFSDIEGINNVRFGACPDHLMLKKLRGRLEIAGCKPDDSGDDWLKPKRFEEAVALPTPKS
jgi:predicted nucleotide-binding protein